MGLNSRISVRKLTLLGILFLLTTLAQTKAEATNCITEMFNMITSGNQANLLDMAVSTGKTNNDLGEYDFCNNNPDTTYATLSLPPLPVYIGTCLPKTCSSSNTKIIEDAITKYALEQGIENVTGKVTFPMTEPIGVKGANVVGFVGFGILGVVCLVGMLVEYTGLFGIVEYEGVEKGKYDKTLVDSKNSMGKFFLAFSFSRNLRKMFWTSQRGDDYLTVFNGLRVLSMAYIIFGHIHESLAGLPITNPEEAQKILTNWYGIFVMGAFYAVDTFFFLSAFLGAYLMIPKLLKINILNLCMIYIHRFIRILPTLALYIGIILTFLNFLGSGPIWHAVDLVLVQACSKYWWTVLTFSNNFYPNPPEFGCVGVLWYISNDMMFFMVLPIVIFVYCRNRYLGYAFTCMLIMANIITVFIISAVGKHPMTIIKDDNSRPIYHKPFARFGAYFMGCFFGILYYEWKKAKTNPEYSRHPGAILFGAIERSRALRSILHVFGFGVILFLVMITYTETSHPKPEVVWPQMASNFFNAFHRPTFVLALILFLSGAIVGKSRFLRFALGGSAWAPWAKITFMVYLVHIIVIIWFYTQVRQALYITTRVTVFYWFSSFMLSYLVAIPIALLIESPVLQLEKLLIFATPPKQVNLQKLEEELEVKTGLLTPDRDYDDKLNNTKAE